MPHAHPVTALAFTARDRAASRRRRLASCAAVEAAQVRLVERERLATTVDRDLEAACRAEAGARVALGTIARDLLRGGRYRRLGFVRVSDYARERLGVSARALESAAHVAGRLQDLPEVAAAFRDGWLSWTKLRSLVEVARGNERAWLEYARTHSASDVATAAHGRVETTGGRPTSDDSVDLIDGEPIGLLRLACPGRIRSLWRHACEMASRVAGRPLTGWQAAELVAAEAIAGRPAGVSIGDRVLLALLRLARRRPRTTDRRARDAKLDDAPAIAEGAAHDGGRAAGRGTNADPFDLDRRLREAVRALREVEPRMGRLLRVMVDHHLHRVLGYRSLDDYARERLGISLRKVWALVQVERGIRRAAPFAGAYEEGDLSWVRALAVLPVVDRFNADAWLARAKAVTVRRLTDEVNWVLDRRDLEGPNASTAPPPFDCQLTSPAASAPAVHIGADGAHVAA